MATIDELRKIRLSKLEELKKLGFDPYPSEIIRDQTVVQARDLKGKKVAVAGRLKSLRGHGKIMFADLVDETGKIQIVFKTDFLSSASFKLLNLIDLGDFVSVQGEVSQTQSGEISIFASDFQIISKALRPLPDQWHGLKDIEERYRQRYVDLLMNPEVKNVFVTRTKIIRFLREHFNNHGFLEVETPVLQPIYGGAAAKPFVTHHNALDVDLYLRIAVELYLKRLIVGGFEKVYEIGKDFRNEGMDRGHNPEFTMLEFYWAYADYERLMHFTEDMLVKLIETLFGTLELSYQGAKLNFKAPWKRITYRDAILEHTGIDIDFADTEDKLIKAISGKKLKVDLSDAVGYGAVLDAFYKQTTRPNLVGPLFLTERPTDFVSLAKRIPKDPRKTASFQLLIAGREVINAYNELNDPLDQAKRWRESELLGKKGHSEHEAFDDDYIRALEYGMPPTAGWGMGIDNLTAILTDQHALKDVILFPTMRPETEIKLDSKDDPNRKGKKNPEPKTQTPKSSSKKISPGIGYKDADKLLRKYLHDPVNLAHSLESEAIMRAVAKHSKEDEEVWGIIGLLHDLDWELTKDNTKLHCIKTAEILKKAGASEFLIKTIQSHGYPGESGDFLGPPEFAGKTRITKIEHALAAAETLTGLIVATALIQPDKKLKSVKPESLVKKFKNKSFAAKCNRQTIMECESIGINLKDFLEIGLKALQSIHEKINL